MYLLPMLMIDTDNNDIECTVDIDKVCMFVSGGKDLTGIMFDNGTSIRVRYNYDDLMREISQEGDE